MARKRRQQKPKKEKGAANSEQEVQEKLEPQPEFRDNESFALFGRYPVINGQLENPNGQSWAYMDEYDSM